MFPTNHRLRREKDIKTLFAKGKGVFGVGCGLKYRLNYLGLTRVTVVVGTAVSKRAVVRNRIKRRIRAVIRQQLGVLPKGYDLVVTVRKEMVNMKAPQIVFSVMGLLRKAKLLP